ncbi:MAG: ribosomal protein S18-alanine N-acetyltransferase [Lachnospiraceae bacterium]|nr:ribosomal protein S18-alanine N-acetyltransferase [Lachnospiraceae bacterium]
MIQIRQMTEADTAAAAALEAACFSQPWSEKSFLDALHNPNTLYLMAEADGRFAGMCGLWQSFDEADIMNVAVDPAFRRQKIAELLMEELMRRGQLRGITAFTLEVRASNEAAIGLYEKCGFITEGVRKNFYENPTENALIMWKR